MKAIFKVTSLMVLLSSAALCASDKNSEPPIASELGLGVLSGAALVAVDAAAEAGGLDGNARITADGIGVLAIATYRILASPNGATRQSWAMGGLAALTVATTGIILRNRYAPLS